MGSSKNLLPDFKNPPNFAHFQKITNKIGIVQHCKGSVPDKKFGYALDDNARALLVSCWAQKIYPQIDLQKNIKIYLKFIQKMQRPDGQFHNFLSWDGKFLDKVGSQDSFGRTFWALRFYLVYRKDFFSKVRQILAKTKKYLKKFRYLRSKAFVILGLSYGFDRKDTELMEKLSDDLVANFNKNSDKNWRWFEKILTYSNGILPLAFLASFKVTKKPVFLEIALKSLDFLLQVCREKDRPAPIGNAGWYKKDGKKALFDQQCIEIADMVLALVAAYKVTQKKKYFYSARDWFLWFYGNNIAGVKMYNPKTGAAFDGLEPKRINKNQGAESTLAYLLSYLALAEIGDR